MSLIRAFIAIPIPARLQEKILLETAPLRSRLESGLVRWVASENIHLTLKFLGDTSEEKLDALKKILTKEVVKFQPFEISVRKIGVFPKPSRPSVIWIGIENSGKLSTLHRCVERAASQIGSVPEKRPFSAHLTLGRVTRKGYGSKPRALIQKMIEESPVYDFGSVQVSSVQIFQSELTPSGAKHRSLFEANLGDFFE